jgi:hypothetical protein
MQAAREGSSELRRRWSQRQQRAESAVVGRGRERRRRHYGQRRRHMRMCRGRHGDDPVQESSSHRSQTTSTFGRQISSQPKQRPHTAAQPAGPVRVQRESTSEREMGQHLGRGVRAHVRERGRTRTGTEERPCSSSSSILGQSVSQFRRGPPAAGPYEAVSNPRTVSRAGDVWVGILCRAGKEVEVCVLASLASSQSSSGFTLVVNAGADQSVSQFRRAPPALTT